MKIFTLAQLGTFNKLRNVFHKRRLPKPSPITTWDIGLMLCALTLAFFEPLETASLEAVTYKMFVLIVHAGASSAPYAVASSSARRRTGLLCCYI